MKKQKIKYVMLYCILAAIWGVLIASLFIGCNVYEKEPVEIIRCPQTDIEIPEDNLWDEVPDSNTGKGH